MTIKQSSIQQPSLLAVWEERWAAEQERRKNQPHLAATEKWAEDQNKLHGIKVSPEDSDLLKRKWPLHNGYAVKQMKTNGIHRNIKMSRVILRRKLGRELSVDEFCDHINGNPVDNRRDNLRPVNRFENRHNIHRFKNKTGYIGVSYHKGGKLKWMACIRHTDPKTKQVTRYWGLFPTPETAARAYNRYAEALGCLTRNRNVPDVCRDVEKCQCDAFKRAKERGIIFDPNGVDVPKYCPWCGMPIPEINGKSHQMAILVNCDTTISGNEKRIEMT